LGEGEFLGPELTPEFFTAAGWISVLQYRECIREPGRGQFHKFGAVEKKSSGNFCGLKPYQAGLQVQGQKQCHDADYRDGVR
jgi:hypothetical protein